MNAEHIRVFREKRPTSVTHTLKQLKACCLSWSKASSADSLKQQTALQIQIAAFQNKLEAGGYTALGLSAMIWLEILSVEVKNKSHRQIANEISSWLDSAETYLHNPLNRQTTLAVIGTIRSQWQRDLSTLFLMELDPEQAFSKLRGSFPIGPEKRLSYRPGTEASSTSIFDMFRDKIKNVYPVLIDYAGFIKDLPDYQHKESRLINLITTNLIDDYKIEINDLIEIAELGKFQGIIEICKTAIEYCNDFQQNRVADLPTVGFVLENIPQRLLDGLSSQSQPGLLAN